MVLDLPLGGELRLMGWPVGKTIPLAEAEVCASGYLDLHKHFQAHPPSHLYQWKLYIDSPFSFFPTKEP